MGYGQQWKLPVVLGFVLFVAAGLSRAEETLAEEFEALAGKTRHFSRSVVIWNQALRLPRAFGQEAPPEYAGLAPGQLELRDRLRKASTNREALADLLRHPDPKVRNLVLGAIFQREDGHDLPLIATLLEDESPTFPDLHDSIGRIGFSGMEELETGQKVSDVASAMLAFWDVPVGRHHERRWSGMGTTLSRQDFERCWKRNGERPSEVVRFLVKFERACGGSPYRSPEEEDLARVAAEMEALPLSPRAWTALYVRSRFFMYEFVDPNNLSIKRERMVSDAALLADLKSVGAEAILLFLQRRRIDDDPGLWFDLSEEGDPRIFTRRYRDFSEMADFILRHASELLRAEDAAALLACETVDHEARMPSPWWSAAAAELLHSGAPDEAAKVLDEALLRFPPDLQMPLLAADWRMRGMEAEERLTDWFYEARGNARFGKGWASHSACELLRFVDASTREEKARWFAALVADPRFEQAGRPVRRLLQDIATRDSGE